MRLALGGVVAVALAGALAGAVPPGRRERAAPLEAGNLQATTPAGQQARFRAGVNFVSVDVYPTADGRPVNDLAKDDFEVLEDGVPQVIASFEHIVVAPGGPLAEKVEPTTVDEANRMAADPHNRVFVLFVDTYHVTDPGAWHDARLRMAGSPNEPLPKEKKPLIDPNGIEKALVKFVDRTLAPTDLIAVMTPEMDPSQMTFSRRSEHLDELLHTAWARRFSWDNLDPDEERWFGCFPPDTECEWKCFTGIAEEMVLRRRERVTLETLKRLVATLRTIREGRIAVLLVTEGWSMFGPNSQLARPLAGDCFAGCPTEIPQGKKVHVGPDGKLQLGGTDPRDPQLVDRHDCDVARVDLSNFDSQTSFRQVVDDANRANTSFYPIDPRGLAVWETPPDAYTPDGAAIRPGVNGETDNIHARQNTLRDLAGATDGQPMLTSNDLGGSLKKISDDLSNYYLLGYNSTNAKPDGRFRSINVRVKRPGVEVRARRGYRAPTEAELARASAAVSIDPEAHAREQALESLSGIRNDRVMHVAAGYGWDGALPTEAPSGPRPFIWLVTELDAVSARSIEWTAGADVTLALSRANGEPLGTITTTLPASSPRTMTLMRDVQTSSGQREALRPGDYIIQVRGRAKIGDALPVNQQVRVTIPGAPAGPFADTQIWRRGPFTGPLFQPTADLRFRKAERIREDVPLAAVCDNLTARLLDRKGQPLPIPVTVEMRQDGSIRFASAEASLAPLAQGDYILEIAATVNGTVMKRLTAFRVVP